MSDEKWNTLLANSKWGESSLRGAPLHACYTTSTTDTSYTPHTTPDPPTTQNRGKPAHLRTCTSQECGLHCPKTPTSHRPPQPLLPRQPRKTRSLRYTHLLLHWPGRQQTKPRDPHPAAQPPSPAQRQPGQPPTDSCQGVTAR